MTSDDKLNAIQGRRETLLHEQFGAELDAKVAAAGGDVAALKQPEARLDEVNAKLKALDEVEAEVKAKPEAEKPASAAE